MVIVSRNATVNQLPGARRNPHGTGTSAISPPLARIGVYAAFIAIFKLPFKFDRSWSSQQAGKRRGTNGAF
jgi:hypothetical protein